MSKTVYPADFPQRLLKNMEDEATAHYFYRQLAELAPSPYHKEFIEHAASDEKKHYMKLGRLYFTITGKMPQVRARPMTPTDYYQGLKQSIPDELGASHEYRSMMLASPDQPTRDMFFELLTDEMDHAISFSVLMTDVVKGAS